MRGTLLVAGTPGFDFATGEVWAVHTAWSGNHTTYAPWIAHPTRKVVKVGANASPAVFVW